jgi:hypothetical protein
MDVALCQPDSLIDIRPGLRQIGELSSARSADLNIKVRKEGAETGVTEGTLTIRNASILVDFPSGSALFENQYAITALGRKKFGKPGDSGALVVDKDRAPIGILFAVSSQVNQAYVNPIGPILEQLGIRI